MRRRLDLGFAAELSAAAALLVLLALLAWWANARATGVTNMLLGAGGNQLLSTLTAGTNVSSGTGFVGYCTVTDFTGCASSIGSLSASSIPGGYTIRGIVDVYASSSYTGSELAVSGFSASPGASWITRLVCNGVGKVGSTATYNYSTGTATWVWPSSESAFGFSSGNNYSCYLVWQ